MRQKSTRKRTKPHIFADEQEEVRHKKKHVKGNKGAIADAPQSKAKQPSHKKISCGNALFQSHKLKSICDMIYEDDCDEGLAKPKGSLFDNFQRTLLECGNRPGDLSEAAIDVNCQAAAKAVVEADAILLFAGAGCSADCGLPVYRDIVQGNSTAGAKPRKHSNSKLFLQ